MEKIRLIETKNGNFKIQQEMLFSEELSNSGNLKNIWIDRSEPENYEESLKEYEEFKLNGVPDFIGDNYYTTPEKNIIFEDEVEPKWKVKLKKLSPSKR